MVEEVSGRLLDYQQVLRGGVGLLLTAPDLSRKQWHDYVSNADMTHQYPGIQNLAVSIPVPADKKEQHIASVRAEGFPDYSIRPELPVRPVYFSNFYNEPAGGRNQRAFGFDMYTDPVRKMAMDHAIDTGLPTISGMVILKQETNKDVQQGFIFCLPVYHAGLSVTTIEQRREALRALVCGAFRMNDLMAGIFGGTATDIDLEIFDDAVMQDDHRMYASANRASLPVSYFSHVVSIDIGGRKWALRMSGNRQFLQSVSSLQSTIVVAAGLLFNLALFIALLFLDGRERKAQQLADRMTRDLFEKEARFSGIITSASDAIVSKNLAGIITSWNPAAQRMFGYKESDMLGQGVLPATPAERSVDLPQIAARVAGGEYIKDVETVRQCKDGRIIDIAITYSPIRDSNGQVSGVSEVISNITQRKQVDKLKSEFISTVSHELRTPLTAIRGSLGLVVGGAIGPISDPVKTMLLMADKNCQRLMHLIDDILDVEKLASGKYHFNLQRHDLSALVAQTVQDIQAYAHQVDVRLVMKADMVPIYVEVDSERIVQVLTNLLSNAAKYSPAGQQVDVSILRQTGKVRVEVRDYGQGVPDEFKTRIFQKFAQADSSDTRPQQCGSTGLGLSIAKDIVEQHGGTIGFISEEGQGSCFYFELTDNSRAAEQAS